MSGTPPPTTLRDMLDSDVIRFVNNMQRLGFTGARLEQAVRDRYPAAPPLLVSVRAAINRADAARAAGRALDDSLTGEPLKANQLTAPLAGCTRWKYTTLVTWTDSSGHVGHYPVTRDYTFSQTRNQVQADAINGVSLLTGALQGSGNPNYPSEGAIDITGVEIWSAERACP